MERTTERPAAAPEAAGTPPWLRPSLTQVLPGAPVDLLDALRRAGVAFEVREHDPPRHARHLAALWEVPLPHAGRATLFMADERAVLVVVPADRKVSAPALRRLLNAADLRVLRGDRGVGRLGWAGLLPPPGALPAVPAMFGAASWVDRRVLDQPQIVIGLGSGRSIRLAPADYVRVTRAVVERISGSTRLLPDGGMTEDPW